MNDLENRLVDFLKEEADDAQRGAVLPKAVQRRVRRRQVRNSLAAGVVAAAVVAVFAAGFTTFAPLGKDRNTPAGPGIGGSSRTAAALSFVSITYPADWPLVELQGLDDDPAGTRSAAVLQLTNWATDHTLDTICSPGAPKEPADGVALVVFASGGAPPNGSTPLNPASLQLGGSDVTEACAGATGESRMVGNSIASASALWAWNGISYRAYAWANDGASEADKSALLESFRSLAAPESDPRPAAWQLASPADVLFAGGAGKDAWRIASYPSGDRGTAVEMRAGSAPISSASMRTPSVGNDYQLNQLRVELGFPRWPANEGGPGGSEELGPAVLYGIIPGGSDVEIRSEGNPMPVALRRTLTGYGNGWDAFAIPMDSIPGDGVVFVTSPLGQEFSVALGQLSVFSSTSMPSADKEAQSKLRNAIAAALTLYTDSDSYAGVTPETMTGVEPALTYDSNPVASTTSVSIRDVRDQSIVLVAKSLSGTVFCLADDRNAGTTYGTSDAQTITGCSDSNWPSVEEPASPSPTPSASDLARADAEAAQNMLRNAVAAATVHFREGGSYEGFTPETAASLEPSITFNDSPIAVHDEVSIRDASEDQILLATRASDGAVYCIAVDPMRFADQPVGKPPTTFSGSIGDPANARECAGGFDNGPGG